MDSMIHLNHRYGPDPKLGVRISTGKWGANIYLGPDVCEELDLAKGDHIALAVDGLTMRGVPSPEGFRLSQPASTRSLVVRVTKLRAQTSHPPKECEWKIVDGCLYFTLPGSYRLSGGPAHRAADNAVRSMQDRRAASS